MLVLGLIVVLAVVVMLAANRYNRMNGHLGSGAMARLSVIDIDDRGLHCKSTAPISTAANTATDAATDTAKNGQEISASDQVIPWASIVEVAVANRREVMRKRFSFELLVDGVGLLVIDDSSPHGEALLSQTHNLAGFDHSALIEALRRRVPRTVCYSG